MSDNINRFNVWSNNHINKFALMVEQHHQLLDNFRRVGALLETSGKIYGVRVDSVHADVIRMSSGIRRQSLGQNSFLDITAVSGMITTDVDGSPSILPIRRRHDPRTTVIGNRQLINAPLQTLEVPGRPLNLLQNGLSSDCYALSLQPKQKFLTDRDVARGLNEFNELEDGSLELPVVQWIPSNTDIVRPQLNGYDMSDSPCEHFRNLELFSAAVSGSNTVDNIPLNSSEPSTIDVPFVTVPIIQPDFENSNRNVERSADPVPDMDLQFDIDADPVPINNEEPSLPPVADSLSEDDRNALREGTALHLNTTPVDDMRPLTSTPLQYSYRRLSNASSSTDAGHWTFPSINQSTRAERETARRRRRRRIAVRDTPVLFTSADSENIEENFLSVDDPRARAIRKSNQKKWQSSALTIPTRMRHSSAMNFHSLILDAIHNEEPNEREPTVVIDSDDGHDIDEYEPMEVEIDPVDLNPVNDSASIAVNVELTIEGADDYVISPPLTQPHISPANVDVEAIIKRCLEIIVGLEAAGGEPTFGQVYRQLELDGRRPTPALTFSCILELANRHNFRLDKIGDTNDFVIKRI